MALLIKKGLQHPLIRNLRIWGLVQLMRMNRSTNTTTRSLKCQKVFFFVPHIPIDEIPIVLLELNESALAYITREQFDKALLLL